MDENYYTTTTGFTIPACPIKSCVPKEILKVNGFISTLSDEQLATVAEEIYHNTVGEYTHCIMNWLDEITKLPDYHSYSYVQLIVSKEIIRRYINSIQ